MKLFCLLFFSFVNIISIESEHDIAIAVFDFTQKEEKIILDIHFDKEDLEAALAEKESVENYLFDHLKIQVNHQYIPIKIDQININDFHYEIKGSLNLKAQKIQSIHIQNTCLVEEIPNHSNVIHANFNDKTRGFRMHLDRQEISFEY